MQIQHDVHVGQFCWLNARIYLNGGGKINHLYLPETVEELKECVSNIQQSGKPLFIFGHTSNCYFLPSFCADSVISTRKLTQYQVFDDKIVCQPGAHIKKIAKELTYNGIKGYSGLVDLPGTVAAAVVGNAGCFGCETKDIVESVELLLSDGAIKTLSNVNLGFRRRSSILKRKEIEGVILSVTLKKEKGNKDELISHAEQCHTERKKNQPSPANNLGSNFMSGSKTLKLRVVERLVRDFGRLFKLDNNQQFRLLLRVFGKKNLIPYLFNLNRFMWIDEKSHEAFEDYTSFYKKIYRNANLEILLFK